MRKKWLVGPPDFQCAGKYKGGGKPTKEDFARILKHHAEWLSDYADEQPRGLHEASRYDNPEARKDKRRANLCGADLRAIELKGVDLRVADLQGANLTGKNLTGINLERADLTGAILIRTNLEGANFRTYRQLMSGADLCATGLRGTKLSELYDVNASHAFLYEAELHSIEWANICRAHLTLMDLSEKSVMGSDLSDVSLDLVNLSKAIIANVNFRRARLNRVNLHAATVTDVDMTKAYFSPTNAEGLLLIGAEGLSSIILSDRTSRSVGFTSYPESFAGQTAALILRKTLKESGLRNEERAITSALRKFALQTEPTYVWVFETVILGGLITDYGAQPWRSLIFLVAGIPVFSPFYVLALRTRGQTGIWAMWPPDRVHKEHTQEVERVTSTFFSPRLHLWSGRKWHERVWQWLQVPLKRRWIRVPLIGLYFSLLSAFHLGWRELNVGSWIARLQPREYTLRATGWVRVASEIQSLISVYLLALWALTYFSRPFE